MKYKYFILIILIMLLSFIFCLPYLLPINKIMFEDQYLQFCAYLDLNLLSFFKDYKIPLWAYHFGGGYPIIKHPDTTSLSPIFFLLILPFGTAAGIKLFILFSYLMGGFGFFYFAYRILNCNAIASGITSLIYIFNSFMPYAINTGCATKEPNWFYLPLITSMLFLTKKNRRFIFFCACLITLMLFNGFSLNFASLGLFLFILVLLDALSKPENRTINRNTIFVNLFLILAIAFLLGAIKSFPLLDLLKINIREVDDYLKAVTGPSTTAMNFPKLILALFSKGPYADGNEALMGANGLGTATVAYFGIIPALFFLLSCIFCFRKVFNYLVVMLIFILISMANNIPVDLFRMLWHLPLFHSMQDITPYFFFPVIFIIPVIIAIFFSSAIFNNFSKKFKFVIYLVLVIGIIDMFIANSKYFKFASAYEVEVPKLRMENSFFSVKTIDADAISHQTMFANEKKWSQKQKDDLFWGLNYYLLRQNIGLINWPDELRLETHAVPKYYVTFGYGDYWKDFRRDLSEKNGIIKNKDYRGECYFSLDKNNKVNGILWKTNEMIVNVDQVSPDQLIINQNYDPSWKSNLGKVFDANGLIGVDLNKPVKGKIVLSYRLKSFYIGLITSVMTLIVCLIYFFGKKRKIKIEK